MTTFMEDQETEVVYRCCCGIDVHKKLIVACLNKGGRQELREFGTAISEIKALANWLAESGCEMIAMESTGMHWKPLYELFELMDPECHSRQRIAYEGTARTQDRCKRCGMDCRFVSAWAAQGQLYPEP